MEPNAGNVSVENEILRDEEGATDQIHAPFDSLEEFEICAEIAKSGFFDETYYLANSPDVAATNLDPLTHYIRYGEREGRKPCKSLDPAELRRRFAGGQCLLLQYIRSL